jgi:mannose-6-phosphate isomerase-like protein (cupin superfamily)
MSISRQSEPPASQESYVIPQLEGERITIPGSKGVFRILASAKQTNNKIAVFTSGAVLSDAPGFHYHNEAHDVFLVTKGYLKLWNGDQCRIMGPGDFAYVPPVSLTVLVYMKIKFGSNILLESYPQPRNDGTAH